MRCIDAQAYQYDARGNLGEFCLQNGATTFDATVSYTCGLVLSSIPTHANGVRLGTAIGVWAEMKAAATVGKEATTRPGLSGTPQGPASRHEDTTRGRSVHHRSTNVTKSEFEQNHRDAGWTEKKSQDGLVNVFEKDGAKYATRDTSKTTKSPTADFTPAGAKGHTIEIRLGGSP
jgi:hypothetical protein